MLLPGVGNFDPAMHSIRDFSKIQFHDYVGNVPVLGICLGMQLMARHSQEGDKKGFCWFDADIIKFRLLDN